MTNFKELINGFRKAKFIYIVGNGGSASTANHFANDLVKISGKKAISLCANEAVVMAYANDNGYENVFVDQLKVFLTNEDMLVTISGSGKSPNVLKAIKYAKKIGCAIYKMPTMKELGFDMQRIEDHHLRLCHEISDEI